MIAIFISSYVLAATVKAEPSPTPFPVVAPSPTATPAVPPPNSNPYLDATFRAPRLVSPGLPNRLYLLSNGKFLVFYTAQTLVNREAGCLLRYNADGSYDPTFEVTGVKDIIAVAEVGTQLIVAAHPNANSAAYENASTIQVLRLNSDGSVDSTFANDAVADGIIQWLTVQADGKILVAGDFASFAGAPHPNLVRLLPSGQLDNSFTPAALTGGGGTTVLRTVVQPDGRILIGGIFTEVGGTARPSVARLNANGTRDNSFLPSGFGGAIVRGIILLDNGQVVIGGRLNIANYRYLPLLRLNANGSLDGSFGCYDQSLFGPSTGFTRTRDVVRQSDGSFVAVTTRSVAFNDDSNPSNIFRFNPDGSLDNSFHLTALRGFVPGTSDFRTASANLVAVEASGTILIVGSFNSIDNDGIVRYGVARLQSDGTATAFAPELAGLYDYPAHLTRFSDGQMWISCTPNSNEFGPYNTFPHNLTRLNANGTFDFSFDLASSVGNSRFLFSGITGLAGDKALVWGTTDPATYNCFRMLSGGTVDTGFTFDPTAPRFAEATALSDGKLLLSAERDAQSTLYASLSRLLDNGTLDATFHSPDSTNDHAIRSQDQSLDYMYVGSYALAVQPDGKILYEYYMSDGLMRLVRLNLDGSIDASFTATTFTPTDVVWDFPTVHDPVRGITLQPPNGAYTAINPLLSAQVLPDGNFIIGGHFTSFNGGPARGLIRLLANGNIDNSFSVGGGAQWTSIPETTTRFPAVEGVSVLASGDLLIVGDFQAFNGVPAPGIARLHSDGSVDTSFNPPVHRIYERTATAKLFPQADGSLVLTGPYCFAGENIPRSLVRLVFDHPLLFSTAVSRKEHGSAGNFDVTLPGVECRTGGASGNQTFVFTFSNQIVSGNANVTADTGTVSGSPTFSNNTMTVNLTGVSNDQMITVTLTNVTDTFSQVLPDTSFSAGFLLGDTNGDGFVNAGDALQTRNRSGQATDATNFRSDVNADGLVNSGDTTIVRGRSGTSLP